MEDAQVVGVLNVALVKVKMHGILLGRKVQGVKRLRLRFSDGWDVG